MNRMSCYELKFRSDELAVLVDEPLVEIPICHVLRPLLLQVLEERVHLALLDVDLAITNMP